MGWPAGGAGTAVALDVATSAFVNTNYRDLINYLRSWWQGGQADNAILGGGGLTVTSPAMPHVAGPNEAFFRAAAAGALRIIADGAGHASLDFVNESAGAFEPGGIRTGGNLFSFDSEISAPSASIPALLSLASINAIAVPQQVDTASAATTTINTGGTALFNKVLPSIGYWLGICTFAVSVTGGGQEYLLTFGGRTYRYPSAANDAHTIVVLASTGSFAASAQATFDSVNVHVSAEADFVRLFA